jgi:hypothetical protein
VVASSWGSVVLNALPSAKRVDCGGGAVVERSKVQLEKPGLYHSWCVLPGVKRVALTIWEFSNINNIDEDPSSRIRLPVVTKPKLLEAKQWPKRGPTDNLSVAYICIEIKTQQKLLRPLSPEAPPLTHCIKGAVPSPKPNKLEQHHVAGFSSARANGFYAREPACLSDADVNWDPISSPTSQAMTGSFPILQLQTSHDIAKAISALSWSVHIFSRPRPVSSFVLGH